MDKDANMSLEPVKRGSQLEKFHAIRLVTNLWTQSKATIQERASEHQKNCYRSKSQKTEQVTYATEKHTRKAYLIQSHYLE